MMVVVGQEVYEDSPYTRDIYRIMEGDVDQYYLMICAVFIVVNIILFCVLWTWLRLRVTDRINLLTNKLQSNDQNEKQGYQSNNTIKR